MAVLEGGCAECQGQREAVQSVRTRGRLCNVSGLEGGCAAWQGWREVQAGAWKYYGEIILNIIRQERKRNTEKIPWRKNLQCKLFIVVYVKNFSLLHQSVFIQDKMHRTQKVQGQSTQSHCTAAHWLWILMSYHKLF